MTRIIFTGAPGCGKTSLLHALKDQGHTVIEEAATDVIAAFQRRGIDKPWLNPDFIDTIIAVQKDRQLQAKGDLQFYDRSPLCTYALAIYLGFEASPALLKEIERVKPLYDRRVFFIENLGFIEKTDARQISFEESLRFEEIHKKIYEKFGYTLLPISALPIQRRLQRVEAYLF